MEGKRKTRRFCDLEPREQVRYLCGLGNAVKLAEENADRLAKQYGLDNLTVRASLAKIIGDKALEKVKKKEETK